MPFRFFRYLLFIWLASSCRQEKEPEAGKDWPNYGGNKFGNRYSPLDQINLANVDKLQVAWSYFAGATPDTSKVKTPRSRPIQCQPIVIDGVLYGTTADLSLFALHADTGKEIWKFIPMKDGKRYNVTNSNRGVTYWSEGDDKRILYSAGSLIFAVNAVDGKLVNEFGNDGIVDLHTGLVEDPTLDISKLSVTANTPGIVFKDLYITGSTLPESGDALPGNVRAFNAKTGKLAWVFHTIPRPGETGYETWPKDAWKYMGAANNWSGLTVDAKRGDVFFGTGSPSADFYGGNRQGQNLFANCIISLDASSGKLNWYYQVIHHDLWDRDLPCAPNLATITREGKKIDVVAQATKDGFIYVLDRETGQSLFPVEERKVPVNGLPGETPWPTQKFPSKPAPFASQVFTDADITDISPEAHEFVADIAKKYSTPNKFTPPDTAGIIAFGFSGGAEWGGNAVSPDGILYQNANNDPWILQMMDSASRNNQLADKSVGNALYLTNCSACHSKDRRGSGNEFPSLVNIDKKRRPNQIHEIIKNGSGRMPSFARLTSDERTAIVNFLLNKPSSPSVPVNDHLDTRIPKSTNPAFGFKPAYVINSWRRLVDADGYPGVKPPWGTLNAIDLSTGNYLWRIPFGEYKELTKKGVPQTGTPNYGGPVITASGLLFIGATMDEKFRAFDMKSGKVVWEYQLPAGGFATPAVYEVKGKQYIVIAAGGGRGGNNGGDYIAFSLK